MEPGIRIGRFLLLRDAEGTRHAVSLSATLALCELPDGGGTLMLLPGGRLIRLEAELEEVLTWLQQ